MLLCYILQFILWIFTFLCGLYIIVINDFHEPSRPVDFLEYIESTIEHESEQFSQDCDKKEFFDSEMDKIMHYIKQVQRDPSRNIILGNSVEIFFLSPLGFIALIFLFVWYVKSKKIPPKPKNYSVYFCVCYSFLGLLWYLIVLLSCHIQGVYFFKQSSYHSLENRQYVESIISTTREQLYLTTLEKRRFDDFSCVIFDAVDRFSFEPIRLRIEEIAIFFLYLSILGFVIHLLLFANHSKNGIHFMNKGIIKFVFRISVSMVSVGIIVLLWMFLFMFFSSSKLGQRELFENLIPGPMPSTIRNLIVEPPTDGEDIGAQFLFQIAPEEFYKLIGAGFKTNISCDATDINEIQKKVNHLQTMNTNNNIQCKLHPTVFLQKWEVGNERLRTIATDQNTNWVYYEVRRK